LHSHRVVKYPANSNEFTPGLVVAGSTAGNLTTNTSVVATSGSALNQLDGAQGIWVKPNGDLYVVEFYNLRVTKWASGATSGIIVAGGNGWGNALNQLSGPSDILFDANDNMYVTAASIGRVLYYPPNATIGTIVVDGLPVTNGIAFNNNGELHMSVSGNSEF
jgi:sugar lactone lactonase YvrE